VNKYSSYLSGIIIFFLVVNSVNKVYPQKYLDFKTWDTDSLLLLLPGQLAEERVNTLNFLATSFSPGEFDLARQYAKEAIELATELDFGEGIAAAYMNLGHINTFQSNYPDALKNYYESLRLYEELDKKNSVASLYYHIAVTHYFARNYDKAIEFGNISLDKYREPLMHGTTVGSLRDTIKVFGGISLIYEHKSMWDKSFKIRKRYLEVAEEFNFETINLVISSFMLGVMYIYMGKSDSGKIYYNKALEYMITRL